MLLLLVSILYVWYFDVWISSAFSSRIHMYTIVRKIPHTDKLHANSSKQWGFNRFSAIFIMLQPCHLVAWNPSLLLHLFSTSIMHRKKKEKKKRLKNVLKWLLLLTVLTLKKVLRSHHRIAKRFSSKMKVYTNRNTLKKPMGLIVLCLFFLRSSKWY